MKMNPEKCHVMIIGNDDIPEHFTLNTNNTSQIPVEKSTNLQRKCQLVRPCKLALLSTILFVILLLLSVN